MNCYFVIVYLANIICSTLIKPAHRYLAPFSILGGAPALPQSPETSSPPPLSPSTAPARLYTGKGGRERKRTSKGATAKAEGWLTTIPASGVRHVMENTKVVYLEIVGADDGEVPMIHIYGR
jgi:hypothetical protein